jgi:hypothetical protein
VLDNPNRRLLCRQSAHIFAQFRRKSSKIAADAVNLRFVEKTAELGREQKAAHTFEMPSKVLWIATASTLRVVYDSATWIIDDPFSDPP